MHISSKFLIFGFLGAFILLLTLSASAADVISVAKDNVNLRRGPGTNTPILFELSEGYPLKVTDKKGSWLKAVDYENDSGWIESSLTRTGDTVIVKAKNSVNLRSEPNTKCSIIVVAYRGVVLKKTGMHGQWIHVSHSSGISGWIHRSLVWPQ